MVRELFSQMDLLDGFFGCQTLMQGNYFRTVRHLIESPLVGVELALKSKICFSSQPTHQAWVAIFERKCWLEEGLFQGIQKIFVLGPFIYVAQYFNTLINTSLIRMQIKHYSRQGFVCWSNSKSHSELFLSAALEPDEQSLYNLDICLLDMQERNKEVTVIGNGYSNVPFRCVAWDVFGQKQNIYPHGLIFGGMENGSYSLWNPNHIINSYPNRESPSPNNVETQAGLIYEEEAEDNAFPIMCAEWNSLKNNFLAFGSTDVLILDVSKDVENAEIVKPGKKNPHEGSYVTSVAWNKEVAHILASASENGLIALWDIKTDSSIFQFKDTAVSTSGSRNVVICWSKKISTQIAVTLDDDKRNELQIWDLRNQKGPIVVIDKPHSKGINAMDWCETDPELILTGGRDGKVVCWNYTQDEKPLSQSQLNSNIFEVKWSKKLPSIYSVSTDKSTLVYTMSDNNTFTYIPKWYKVPVGSAFLGNQTVVTFSENRGRILHENAVKGQADRSKIKDKLHELHNSLTNKGTLEGELDELVKAKNNENEIYDYLGFNKEKIIKEVEKFTGKKREVLSSKTDIKSKPMAYTTMMGEQATNFFASISKVQKVTLDEEPDDEHIKYDMVPRNFNWDIGKEKMIKQNMLIGNYEGAIDAALKSGRTAEALIIAYSVDQSTFNSTLKTFFTETTDNFIMDILKYISSKDTDELVKKYDVKKWKECVALIYSLSGVHGRPPLLRLLASRLRAESASKKGDISEDNPTIICYILAEDFEEIVKLYFESLKNFKGYDRKLMAVEYARRLIVILNSMTRETTQSKYFQKIMREVALISIEQNEKVLAYQILSSYSKSSLLWLDYLIHNTQQLQELKDTIVFKGINIPQMPLKKVQKKKDNQQTSNQISKKKIFDRKEESEPVQERRHEQLPTQGFAPNRVGMPQNNLKKAVSPSSSVQAPPPPPPPPPPPIIKKPVPVPAPQSDGLDLLKSPTKLPLPPPKKFNPPPPPPSPPSQHHPTHQDEEQQEEEEEERPIAKGPVSRNIPVEKKPTPPPLAPPPRMPKKQSEKELVTKMELPPRRANPPLPPFHSTHSQIDEAPSHPPPKIEKKTVQPPPPPHLPVSEPPKKGNSFREEQDQEQATQEVPKRMPPPPPPALKKSPPPPPMRK